LAQLFHESYERLAPQFDYKTRIDSAVPWRNVPRQNKKLMIAVCDELLKSGNVIFDDEPFEPPTVGGEVI
jgi:hypothetical protein